MGRYEFNENESYHVCVQNTMVWLAGNEPHVATNDPSVCYLDSNVLIEAELSTE